MNATEFTQKLIEVRAIELVDVKQGRYTVKENFKVYYFNRNEGIGEYFKEVIIDNHVIIFRSMHDDHSVRFKYDEIITNFTCEKIEIIVKS